LGLTVLVGASGFHLPVAHGLDDPHDVRFAVVGNRGADGLITGETVPVYVPWEGVNTHAPTVACLAGEFRLRSDGDEERVLIGQDEAVALLLRLDSSESGTWEVQQSRGRCAELDGRGVFRRTSWADGSVSYRFIGEAKLETGGSA
jgi:hypothetical protein